MNTEEIKKELPRFVQIGEDQYFLDTYQDARKSKLETYNFFAIKATDEKWILIKVKKSNFEIDNIDGEDTPVKHNSLNEAINAYLKIRYQ